MFVPSLFLVQVVQFATRSDPAPDAASNAWGAQVLNDASRPDIYVCSPTPMDGRTSFATSTV